MTSFIAPVWPLPERVHAVSTTRLGGVSAAPYDSFNLGDHVGDDPQAVAINRQRLADKLHLPTNIVWLEQVHGINVVTLGRDTFVSAKADASYSRTPGQVCAIMTADCLPVLFCSGAGNEVAAAHAGWRGLQAGILERTVAHFDARPENIMAWLGPAIGPNMFEVGAEVREAFVEVDPVAAEAFKASGNKYLADIYRLACQRLNALGIVNIYGANFCTVTQTDLFFSYRREKQMGRMASLIWFD